MATISALSPRNISGSRSELTFKSLFDEVAIESKCLCDTSLSHYSETDAIHKTQVFATSCEQSSDCGTVLRGSDPLDREQRYDLLLERSNCFDPQSVLQESARFHQHIVARHKDRIFLKQRFPSTDRRL